MNTSERLEAFLSKAATSRMESISVPPANHAAIAARVQRVDAVRRPARGRWLAIAAAVAVAIGVLSLPPVSSAIARAAHKFLILTYFPKASKSQTLLMGRVITVEQARAVSKFRFVEPQGLPAGYHLIWATDAPAGAARYIITLRYESSLNGKGLSFMETAAKPGAHSAQCHVLTWSRTPGFNKVSPPRMPSNYRGGTPPPGFRSVPCHGWKVGKTQLNLLDEHGGLTQSQIQHVIQSTR